MVFLFLFVFVVFCLFFVCFFNEKISSDSPIWTKLNTHQVDHTHPVYN